MGTSHILRRVPRYFSAQQIPTGAVEIDWGHPLANGLVALYVPGVSGVDLTRIAPPIVITGSGGTIVSGPRGPALDLSSIGTASSSTGLPPQLEINKGTILWSGKFSSNPSSDWAVFATSYSNPNANPYVPYGIYYAIASSGMAFAYGVVAFASLAFPSGTPSNYNQWGVSFDVAGGNYLGYLNGVVQSLVGTPQSNGGFAFTSTSSLGFGDSRSGHAYSDIGAIWNYQQTADHMAWMNAEPFAMLRPVVRRVYFAARSTFQPAWAARSSIAISGSPG